MKLFKFMGGVFAALCLSLAFSFMAFADEVVPVEDFLSSVLNFVKGAGGMPWTLKIAGIVLLVIASMKVSILRPLWDKLGSAQVWLAPVLGLVGGVLSLAVGGQPLTLTAVVAYLFAGSGAVVLHELLDSVKAMPGVGGLWVSVIDFVSGLLGKKSA